MALGFIPVDVEYANGSQRLIWIELEDEMVFCGGDMLPGCVMPPWGETNSIEFAAHCIAYGINEGMVHESEYGDVFADEDDCGIKRWAVRPSGVALLRAYGIVD